MRVNKYSRIRSLKEGCKFSADELQDKIDEIAEACGDYYFDNYCGGGENAEDPEGIQDELDDEITYIINSGEFISSSDFDSKAEWDAFVEDASQAAWECIYFNYDVAKDQVAMNEEWEAEDAMKESKRSERRSLKEGELTGQDIIEDKGLVNSVFKQVKKYYDKISRVAKDRIGLQASVKKYQRDCIDNVLPATTAFTCSAERDTAAYLLDELISEKLYEGRKLRGNTRKSLKESHLSADERQEKIDEIAEACGDHYFDNWCGGVNAEDPRGIEKELDEYIAETARSDEFASPRDFDSEEDYNAFIEEATDAAWECIYFNYDVAKDQVAMNEEDGEEFNESRRSHFKRKGMKESSLFDRVNHFDAAEGFPEEFADAIEDAGEEVADMFFSSYGPFEDPDGHEDEIFEMAKRYCDGGNADVTSKDMSPEMWNEFIERVAYWAEGACERAYDPDDDSWDD